MPRAARPTPEALSPAPFPTRPSDDPVAEVARRFARALKAETDATSIRAVADASGINHSTLISILKGRAWPDMQTIAKLELGLETDLWPGRS